MTMMIETMMEAFRRVSAVHPATTSVSFCVRPHKEVNAYHASATNEDDLGGGIVLGYGATPDEALSGLCDRLREMLEKERAEGMCSVCAEEGVERKGDIMTGCGMMCHEHAIEWLQSEKEASEEHNGELGPCGVKS